MQSHVQKLQPAVQLSTTAKHHSNLYTLIAGTRTHKAPTAPEAPIPLDISCSWRDVSRFPTAATYYHNHRLHFLHLLTIALEYGHDKCSFNHQSWARLPNSCKTIFRCCHSSPNVQDAMDHLPRLGRYWPFRTLPSPQDCTFGRKETSFTCSSSYDEESHHVSSTEGLYVLCGVCGILSAVWTSNLVDQKWES
jgi:hypothetical protein